MRQGAGGTGESLQVVNGHAVPSVCVKDDQEERQWHTTGAQHDQHSGEDGRQSSWLGADDGQQVVGDGAEHEPQDMMPRPA